MHQDLHLSAALCAKILLNCENLRQWLSFGNSVSSEGVLVIIVGGGKDAVRAVKGYSPQNDCCTDSSALGIGVARK